MLYFYEAGIFWFPNFLTNLCYLRTVCPKFSLQISVLSILLESESRESHFDRARLQIFLDFALQ